MVRQGVPLKLGIGRVDDPMMVRTEYDDVAADIAANVPQVLNRLPPVAEECDPSYPNFCLAPSWVIGDLDCGDIGYRRFTVYPPDSHGFDGDHDGIGCES